MRRRRRRQKPSRDEVRRWITRRAPAADVKGEAESILAEIVPGGIEPPLVWTKHGGYMACYYADAHAIVVRENCWRRMNLAQKRLVLIHEWAHATGLRHRSDGLYHAAIDHLSRELYVRVWGEDEELEAFERGLAELADQVPVRSGALVAAAGGRA